MRVLIFYSGTNMLFYRSPLNRYVELLRASRKRKSRNSGHRPSELLFHFALIAPSIHLPLASQEVLAPHFLV